MIFVLDASVAVAAARTAEPGHKRARAVVESVLRGDDTIVVPAIFGIEVVAALARRGHDPVAAGVFVDALAAAPSEVLTVGPVRARRIRALAAAFRLRAADACYVWAAQRRGVALCTLDDEVLRRSLGLQIFAP